MATNWSKLAKQFLDKIKPADDSSSTGSESTEAPAPSAEKSASSSSPSASSSSSPAPAAKTTSEKTTSEKTTSAKPATKSIDIGRQQIGGVYGKALLGAAGKNAGSVLEELSGLATLVSETPAFRNILDSPRVSEEEKTGLLDRTLKGRVSPVLLNFLKVVSEHGRLDCLQDIHHEARRLFNDQQGIVQVVVTTAEKIESGELKRVKSDLEKKLGSKVDIETAIDPSIIGGIVIRMGDKVYDGSVSQRLKSVREQAVGKAIEKMRSATDTYATSN